MCLRGKGFGSKTKEWIRVQCKEPASLTPRLCFPKQRKNHHHVPGPDAFTGLQVTCAQGILCPCPCLCQTHLGSHTAGISSPPDATYYLLLCICPKGKDPHPHPHPAQLPAGVVRGGRTLESEPWFPSRLHARPARDPQACGFPRICQRGDGGRDGGRWGGGDAGGRNCLTAWSPPSWFSLASSHVPLIQWVTFMKVFQKVTWHLCVCRVLDITTSVQSIKIRKEKNKKTTFIFPLLFSALV